MKFLVDLALGGLAKWLRLAGLDATVTSFATKRTDLATPVPGTYLLTRQAAFGRLKRDDVLVLAANNPEDQLAEVFQRLHIRRGDLAPLSRCSECNELLTSVPRERALGLVPEHVYHSQVEFFQCPRCRRFYWPGSHPARIVAKLQNVLGEQDEGQPQSSPIQKGASHGV